MPILPGGGCGGDRLLSGDVAGDGPLGSVVDGIVGFQGLDPVGNLGDGWRARLGALPGRVRP